MPSFQISKRFQPNCRQRGISLILLIFLIGLVATGLAVRSLSAGSIQIQRNVESIQALKEARDAVIGKALTQSGNNIGQFPCAEDTTLIGLTTEGQAKASCSNTVTSIGRFAWRTMGTGDIRDGNNDTPWYALSAGFRSTPVNSDSVAGLSIDGVANQAIAILFSPGTALSTQSRPTLSTSYAPVVTNYLEGSNADGNASFVTGTTSTTFNDISLAIKPDDIFPILERQVLADIKNYLVAYKAIWGAYPFPAPFADPSVAANFTGVAGTTGGLLPIVDAGLSWASGIYSSVRTSDGATVIGSCSVSSSGGVNNVLTCSIGSQNYATDRTLTITANVNKVGLGFYKQMTISSTSDFTISPATLKTQLTGTGSTKATLTYSLNSAGGGTVTLVAHPTTNAGTYTIKFNQPPQLDDWNTTTAIPNYIYQNNWQRLIYYKVASPYLPGGSGACGSCLTVNKIDVTPNISQANVHALLVSAGRKLNATNFRPAPTYDSANPAQARTSSSLADYLDSTNNTTANQIFDSTTLPLSTFNDQVEVVE